MQKGNQCWLDCGFSKVYKNRMIELKDVLDGICDVECDNIILSHFPIVVESNILNIHGHIHNSPLSEEFSEKTHFCVSLESINYCPINLKEIKRIKQN